ncbi:MAG: hypothetical protein JXQ82_06135 [Methanomicrobiaceae archaeon]|nr:hypothetical protein [Methanomicrobiaceae archaeon]
MLPEYLIIATLFIIIILIFNPVAGIAALIAFIGIAAAISFISRSHFEYDCEEQTETEDEINLIYDN